MGRHPNRHHPISIHAPRGGATTAGGYLRPSTANFNPPAHVGQDQSAHHVGLRRRGFNPRAPRGRDLGNGRPDVVVGISIHLPRVGQDSKANAGKRYIMFSIHLPRVGQDLCKTLKTLSPS